LIPGGFLPLYTLLNRMFILFIPAGIGFLSSMGTIRSMGHRLEDGSEENT